MPFKLRPCEFNIIVFASVFCLALCLYAAVYFNLQRHKMDQLDYEFNSPSYNDMTKSIQELNCSVLSQTSYIAQTNEIFETYYESMQSYHDDFNHDKKYTSGNLYTASRILAYGLNGILAIPALYMFFTASGNINKNFRAKRKNVCYYRNYWLSLVMFFVGLGLLGGSFYAYGKEQTQIGVGIFIIGELMIIAGCYILREYVPTNVPNGYVESDEDIEGGQGQYPGPGPNQNQLNNPSQLTYPDPQPGNLNYTGQYQ